MSKITISKPQKTISGKIQLTGSKSESNRALIMQALSNGQVTVENLSKAADTVTLDKILKSQISGTESTLDVGPAGTAMRFLAAYAAMQTGEIILTGSARMKQRPIGILVDALRTLGAEISYVENEGFPPLRINGPIKQKTGSVTIKANISSQYISALLLIAPILPEGLQITFDGELTSKPYVDMTLAMLEQAGISCTWAGNSVSIKSQNFNKSSITVEPDWSAASYWYAMVALSDAGELFLPGLNQYSLQGDSKITEIMANFGITSQFKDGGVYLKKEDKKLERKIFDFKECPDLAQTVVVCCAALGHDATFTGLETLKIKETDRVNALQVELAKIGVKLIEKNQTYKLDCSGRHIPEKITIETYDDHRMAMAFAPLAFVVPNVEIEDPNVVAKSYPHFWEDLEKVGFAVG
ncbi:MAG: 3-phosphoshikimate 1-carboxyvinyltransferase [Daejeonella sp.]|nr:3-phosphoshikimate 1-carboxyvinyltransferase [Daejeonella sp.]